MEATLNAVKREDFGKNASGRLRRTGMVPAVVYGGASDGGKPEATPIAVDAKTLHRILHSGLGANTLIGLHIGNDQSRVMIREYQLDPISHSLLHADFYRVALDKLVTVTVPIVLKGEARGVKQQGGILDFVHRDIEVECLPADIPQNIELDVSELMLNQGVRVRDIAEAAKWKPITDADMMLVHVVSPKAVEEPTPEAAAAAATATPAEPEVIKKGKKEEEEGAEAAPAAKEKK